MEDLKILDITKYTCLSEIISCDKNEIIFVNEQHKEDLQYYTINSYDIKSNKVEEIYNYTTEKSDEVTQFYRYYKDEIIIIDMSNEDILQVKIIEKNSNKLKDTHKLNVNKLSKAIPSTINNRYFLFFTETDDIFRYTMNLCDLEEDKIYEIKDTKFSEGLRYNNNYLDVYNYNNEEYLIFNEVYMEDYEYEMDVYEYFKNKKDIEDNIECEALYVIKLNDFIKGIKNNIEDLNFIEIKKRCIDGWVRYLCMDKEFIYFREKDFKTQIEDIYKVHKSNLEITKIKRIEHKEYNGEIYYCEEIGYEYDHEDYIKIESIYPYEYNITIKKEKNTFFADYLNNRYIISFHWYEDEYERYFQFMRIVDNKNNVCYKHNGAFYIYDNYIIVYNND